MSAADTTSMARLKVERVLLVEQLKCMAKVLGRDRRGKAPGKKVGDIHSDPIFTVRSSISARDLQGGIMVAGNTRSKALTVLTDRFTRAADHTRIAHVAERHKAAIVPKLLSATSALEVDLGTIQPRKGGQVDVGHA